MSRDTLPTSPLTALAALALATWRDLLVQRPWRLETKIRVHLWLAYFWLISHEVCLCRFRLPRLCGRIDQWLLP